MPDFSLRSTQPEMMDDFSLGHEVIDPIMNELKVINKLLGGDAVFFNAFKKIGITKNLSVADWGCGGGDSLMVLNNFTEKNNLQWELTGLDATPTAVAYANEKAYFYKHINFKVIDLLLQDVQENEYDLVISSLFTHHFVDGDWILLVKKMLKNCKKAVIINDLHRHWFAYYSIGMLTKLFSKSAMVKHDAMLSVLRGFKRTELEALLAKAGIKNYTLKWMWAFRWQLIIYKNAN